MKVLLTGKNGQLGFELQHTLPQQIELIAYDSSELDITNDNTVNQLLKKHKPDYVINAAAYTAVDKAESDIETAYAVNRDGSKNLARTCKLINAKLIHISTDFIFDGNKNTPYQVSDKTAPIGVYGESKLAGELAIQAELPDAHYIIRTAWVYSSHGNNFVKTMLRLMREKDQLGVVYDQVGTPTWARGLAKSIWQLLESKPKNRLYHWTDAGVTSWYDFAVAIQEIALEKHIIDKAIPIRPIPANSYPTPAARPSFSVLDKSLIEKSVGVETTHWREQLASMLNELD